MKVLFSSLKYVGFILQASQDLWFEKYIFSVSNSIGCFLCLFVLSGFDVVFVRISRSDKK